MFLLMRFNYRTYACPGGDNLVDGEVDVTLQNDILIRGAATKEIIDVIMDY